MERRQGFGGDLAGWLPLASFLNRTALPVLPEHLLRDVAVSDLGSSNFGLTPVGSGPSRSAAGPRT